MTKRGRYDPDLTGVDDDTGHSVDYDGGLQAVAEGGRIAVLHGHGTANSGKPTTPAQKPPPPDIDSPFLGLVGSDAHGHPQRRPGHPSDARPPTATPRPPTAAPTGTSRRSPIMPAEAM